jgi:hypothetical protein
MKNYDVYFAKKIIDIQKKIVWYVWEGICIITFTEAVSTAAAS